MMECPSCGNQEYPVLCPAVIVGITNGDKIILSKYEAADLSVTPLSQALQKSEKPLKKLFTEK